MAKRLSPMRERFGMEESTRFACVAWQRSYRSPSLRPLREDVRHGLDARVHQRDRAAADVVVLVVFDAEGLGNGFSHKTVGGGDDHGLNWNL